MRFNHPIITIEELETIIDHPELIILDCSIDKIGNSLADLEMELIPNSQFFDIENQFSSRHSNLPHTLVSEQKFTKEVQLLGINKNSIIVCYDRWGVYSSPRAWWMFKTMGLDNVYVLNGGIYAWKKGNKKLAKTYKLPDSIGNFEAKINEKWIANVNDVLAAITNEKSSIVDARSKARFYAEVDEPRPGLRKGHIKNSNNLPFEQVLNDHYVKSDQDLNLLFDSYKAKDEVVFSCGSGITASILALSNFQINPNQLIRVYDGSWSEWGKDESLPISS